MTTIDAPTRDESVEAWRPPTLLGQSLLQAGRLLRRWRYYPPILVQTFLFPVVLFVMFRTIFGDSIEFASGTDHISALTALMLVCPAMFGALAAGQSLIVEREAGILRRFDSMPIRRGGDILGRAWAELVRMGLSATVVVVVAYLFGFRFAGPEVVPGWLAMLVVITLGFTAIGLTIGAASKNVAQAQGFEALYVVLLFLNTGMVPLEAFPDALQPVVDLLPVSVAVNALDALSQGQAGAAEVVPALVWFGALTVVVGGIGIRLMSSRRS
ncbi:ABC transporter permease [Millisia brevis]|uniref:ABC transporter permease n=1 Tax=Millisia brevis TaxID=264148 RepID=UPI0008305CC8|nr:ABC transporter permease [Millisia brevis]